MLFRSLNSVVSAYYYLGVARQLFTGGDESTERVPTSPSISLSLGAATLGVLVFSIIPMPLMSAARDAAEVLTK